jgi:hypothetical protein
LIAALDSAFDPTQMPVSDPLGYRGCGRQLSRMGAMPKRTIGVIYVMALVVIVVGVDVLFLKHNTWLRLVVNIGIVAVFAALYFWFRKSLGVD